MFRFKMSGTRALLPALLILCACGGSDEGSSGGGTPPPPATYTVGGTVSGLSGSGLVLRNNGSDMLAVSANGAFTFPTASNAGSAYSVTVGTQPASPAQVCTVGSGTGSVGNAAVTSIAVSCVTTALQLSGSLPINGATAVARNGSIVLTFSVPVDAATVTPANVQLSSPAGTQAVQLSVAGSQVTVQPTAPLRRALPYTLSIATAIRGMGGEQVPAGTSLGFRTVDGQWGAPVQISTSGTSASGGRINAERASGAATVWLQPSATVGQYELWSSRTLDGVTWELPAPLNGTVNQSGHRLVLDPAGAITVAWTEPLPGSKFRVMVTRRPGGGSWGTAVQLDDGGGNAANPGIAADPAGNVLAIWTQLSTPQLLQIMSSHRLPDGTWSAPVPANSTTSGSGASWRSLDMDDQGNALAVWNGRPSTSDPALFYNRHSLTSGWGSPAQLLPSGNAIVAEPYIVVDANGNAVAVWREVSGMHGDLWASRYTSSGGWTAAVSIEGVGGDAVVADLASSPDGHVVIQWQETEGAIHNVWATRFSPVSGWAQPELLESSGVDAFGAGVAVETGGNIIALIGLGGGIRTNRFVQGSGWTGLSTSPFSGSNPSFAMDRDGRAFLMINCNTTVVSGIQISAVCVRKFE